MKGAILTIVVTEMAILTAAAIPSLADDLPPLNSQWRETQRGSCFEISQISDPFPGYANCAQIAGRMNERDLMIGYACKTGSDISFFSGLQTDNSIKPDIFVGRYDAQAITVQYCTRISNDWPPEYNCENRMTFKRVNSCKP
jgi:hypothetical protein